MEEKKAKKVYSLNEVSFKEENKTMAILACIPVVGLILLFVEKNDTFVRYYAAQYTILGAVSIVISILLSILWVIAVFFGWIIWLGITVLIVLGMIKASQGERFDIPVISEYALKLMSALE